MLNANICNFLNKKMHKKKIQTIGLPQYLVNVQYSNLIFYSTIKECFFVIFKKNDTKVTFISFFKFFINISTKKTILKKNCLVDIFFSQSTKYFKTC